MNIGPNIFDEPSPDSPYSKLKHAIAYKWHVVRCKMRNLYIDVKDVFFPWNKIKVMNMGRGWHDRDYVLMHAMFTIFVDFIEGEQPFVDWSNKHKAKRHTDIDAMRAFVEKCYGQNAPTDEYGLSRKQMDERYQLEMELISIYEWYKAGKWEFDYEANHYSWEKEKEHDKVCDEMLHKLVTHRHYFWT